jgi:ATP-dependent Lon protease
MPRDNQTKMTKKENNRNKKREEELKKKKINEESSDDESSYTDDDDEEEEGMDAHEYRKLLKKIFPSKHLDNKIKAGERLKKYLKKGKEEEEDEEEEEEDEEEEKYKKKSKKKNIIKNKKEKSEDEYEYEDEDIEVSKKKIKRKKVVSDEEEEEDEEEDEEDEEEEIKVSKKKTKRKKVVVSDEEDEDEDYDDDDSYQVKSPKNSKFNIIFTIGGKGRDDDEEYDDDDDEDEDWESCSDDETETENEDESITSDTENDEESECEEDDEDYEPKKKKQKNVCKKEDKKEKDNGKKKEKEKDKEKDDEKKETKTVEKTTEFVKDKDTNKSILSQLKEIQSKNPNDKSINKCIETYETEIKLQKKKNEKKEKKEKERNNRIFKKILRDKNTMNDFDFYGKLENEQQKKIIKELREINKLIRVEKPYRLTLLESDIPIIFKSAAMKKISSLRYMEPGSGEYYKIKNWVDTFMRIPFSKYETLPLSIADGVDKCHDFMANAQKTLDDAVYGLNDAKIQIMQMLGQLVTNPKAIGSAIAIHGPPGTGKTSLVKEGISKILNRPFAFIALGGATDSSFLEGHSYTYEGSTWGKIVQILIDSKCMNPVIYFDELDKISDTPKGEEIAGILTHLTDTSQNSQFHDKYFSEIDFDLSKCLFIFSYNDETKVNSILKDRMYRIQTKGYNQKQKTVIANNYLLPKIREQVKFMSEDIIIPNDTIHYIIENNCNKEDGVRNLKRCLEIIYTKLNLYRLMKPDTNLFEQDMSLKVQFPFTVTKDIVDKLIKKSENGLSPSLYMLYS